MAPLYSDFQVLIDDAAPAPELGFREYALALSEIIRDSRPEFAIGIFGTWGSGKTTLMRQIQAVLDPRPEIVTAWFTAWRYEREPHLIVPLIDVLREALEAQAREEPPGGPARRAATAMARVGRTFLAGLTFSAGLPGIQASLSPGDMLAAMEQADGDATASLSFYHSAFLMLRSAIEDYSAGGQRRVVIFIDDLDRCFPANALDVLESMKLFFDVPGCVFVVGLDQAVAERAVALKYTTSSDGNQPGISGVDYLKKIFQVPFSLPRVGTDQLDDYLAAVSETSGFDQAQRDDFRDRVARHLAFLPHQDAVNPREIKRLINAYVLQLKMLERRFGESLDPNIVLALQCLSFRPDWRPFYDELAADPALFQETMRDALNRPDATGEVWLAGKRTALSGQLRSYLSSLAAGVLSSDNLASYVSAAESSRSTDPTVLEAHAALGRMRTALATLSAGVPAPEQLATLDAEMSRLLDLSMRRTGPDRLARTVGELERRTKELGAATLGPDDEELLDRHRSELSALIDAVDEELRDLRRGSNLGASS